ncbi:unnamed protein product [Clavelina lepadiformis]|uniref:CUB domain-containing protein n=1 Tax=Clavelina lepadiformis TaxID=159417 RepID=A0ABP0FJT0_CLALP
MGFLWLVLTLSCFAVFNRAFDTSSCGNEFTATNEQQTFTSPGWPDDYENDLFCLWTITAETGKVIRLEFLSFATEDGFDFLEIRSENGSTLLHISGSDIPDPLYSADDVIEILFDSDFSVADKGFEIAFSETQLLSSPPSSQSAACGDELTATSEIQSFRSPGWPHYYQNNVSCLWTMDAETGKVIQLKIRYFITEWCCDVLSIRDKTGSTLYELSGNVVPAAVVIPENEIEIIFISNPTTRSQGFEILFTETEKEPPALLINATAPTCGDEFSATDEEQTLTSPGWPDDYANNLHCLWRITTETKKRIRLWFLSFNTEWCCDMLSVS